MSTPNAQASTPQGYLYEKPWWKLLFNSAGLLSAGFLTLVILGIGLVVTPKGSLFSPVMLRNIPQSWLLLAMLALPTVLIVAGGGIDLSLGAVMGISAAVCALLIPTLGVPAAVAGALAIAILVGVLNGLVTGLTRMNGAVITLGMAALLRGATSLLLNNKPAIATHPSFLDGPNFGWIGLAAALLLGLPLMLVSLRRMGSHTTDAEEGWGARLLYRVSPYVLSAFTAGLAGLALLGRLRAALPTLGTGYEIDLLAVVVLAGTPLANRRMCSPLINLIGALIAALALTLLQTINNLASGDIILVQGLKGVVIVVGGLISTLYYWLIGRIHARV